MATGVEIVLPAEHQRHEHCYWFSAVYCALGEVRHVRWKNTTGEF